jgi:hypothetical protein
MLGAISRAAALAFAAVFTLAAIVAALAAALAFAIILAFTGVLGSVLVERSAAERRFARLEYGVTGVGSSCLHCCSATQQTRNCRSNHQGLHRMLHIGHSSMSGLNPAHAPAGDLSTACEYGSGIRLQHAGSIFGEDFYIEKMLREMKSNAWLYFVL